MQTDATFNTNKFCLSLSVVVEIINTFKTFLIAFCFIISESIKIFKFMNTQLKKLMFYDCLNSAVIVDDFSKNLDAVMMRHRRQVNEDETFRELMLMLSFKVSIKMKKDCILQLCK